jgi:DNA-binding response OmpR family regulator
MASGLRSARRPWFQSSRRQWYNYWGGGSKSREVLIEEIWEQSTEVSTQTIDNFVLRIRKKFNIDLTSPKYFHAVYGFGYKYIPD